MSSKVIKIITRSKTFLFLDYVNEVSIEMHYAFYIFLICTVFSSFYSPSGLEFCHLIKRYSSHLFFYSAYTCLYGTLQFWKKKKSTKFFRRGSIPLD